MHWRRARNLAVGVVAGGIVFVVALVLLLTQTDWGRRRVLAFGLDQLASRVHGTVRIDEIHGNLLTGVRMIGVEIRDTAGRPFLIADTMSMRYSLMSLLRKHLTLNDVRLVNATLVFDQPPGEEWNFTRIFPVGEPEPHRGPGFGSWVLINDMTLRETTIVVRATWKPDERLRGAARERAIASALSPSNRWWVVPVGSGYQSISEFLNVNGRFPLLRLADPDSVNRLIVIDSLSMLALPFKPPGVRVHQLAASSVITADSILLNRVRFVLPGTRGSGVAAYALDGSGARVQLRLPQASFADARFIRPDAPAGSGSLSLAFTSHDGRTHFIASRMDLRSQGARVRGLADFTTGGGTFTVGPSDVRFANVDTRRIRRYWRDAPLADGSSAGHLKLQGRPTAMRVDGNVSFTEPGGPTSHITARGQVGERAGALVTRNLRLRFDPLYLSLVREYEPEVPYRGALTGSATLTGSSRSGFSVVADVVSDDASAGRSHILANGRIETRDGFAVRNLRLRFQPLQLALLEPFAPELPYGGTMTGTTTLTGSRRAGFDVVADVVHNSSELGRSHVTANGWVGIINGLSARALRLGFEPLQVAALRPFTDDLPIDGTLVGTTTVTGSLDNRRIAATLDLEHRGSTGASHAIGRANLNWGRGGYYDVNVRTPTLALATVGAFAPRAGLRGTATGRIVASGASANLTADLDLAIGGDGGRIHVRGVFDLSDGLRRYDFTSTVTAFNAAAVTSRAPQTLLTGTVVARGTGTNAATAEASFVAHLVGSRAAGSPLVDTAIVRARLSNGLAIVDTGHIRLSSARGDFGGSFGLVAGRSGTLRYAFSLDTLSQFITSAAGADTGVVHIRPLVQARRMAQAREDSAHIAQATEVQRAAVGYPPPPALEPDTIVPLRRDTVRGSLSASGTITGNLERFDARGTAQARSLALRGNYLGRAEARYELTNIGTANATLELNAFGDSVRLNGFAFDSARADVRYTGERNRGAGRADIAFWQDADRDYRVLSDFKLAIEQKRLALQTLHMRFDTTRWEAVQPAVISWGKPGVVIDNFELRSNTGGTLRADGRLPTDGRADLRLDIENLQLADIAGLLQDTVSIAGLLGLHARLQGTTRAPVIAGDVTLVQGAYGGTALPDLTGTLNYAGRELATHLELFRDTTRLAVADAQLPIDLALVDARAPRLLRTAPLQVDMRADSLPLEALPSFTTAVSDVRGRVRGNATVRGTFERPRIEGIASVDLAQLRVRPTGVLYHDMVGTIRLRGDTAYVDSIVAHAHGTARAAGTIDFATLARPGFDLTMAARDAVLLDNERGRIRADADLEIAGPYTGVHVAGDLHVRRSVIYLPETVNRRVTNLEDPTLRSTLDTVALGLATLPRPSPLLRNLTVDVGVTIAPDTWARNLQVNAEIYTPEDGDPLRIQMDNARQTLTLAGVINADRGEYTYAGRSFQLSTGSATFIPGPTVDPFLNLTAQYEVQRRGIEALVIQIHVDGNLTRPRVTLQSNSQPPLSQSDLLSYLAFGQPSASLLNMQTSAAFGLGNGGLTGLPALAQQQLASLAIGAAVDQAVAEIEQEGTRSGLDVFRVHAGELPIEAAFQNYFENIVEGTEIEAGKYLNERLFLGARGRTNTVPGVSLEYRGQPGWQWTASWEPRFLPSLPSLASTKTAAQTRVFGVLLLWQRRY
ncbi:MAG: translocation/assembly module TamB domain-containing protein [Gemmatimonadota bacterium]